MKFDVMIASASEQKTGQGSHDLVARLNIVSFLAGPYHRCVENSIWVGTDVNR